MVENVILDVCSFLKTKNILIPSQNQWLRGCITCFRENTQNFSSRELKEFVFDQWKLADLNDICAPSLPNNCKTALKLTLSGRYALQINYIVNIGESYYKQLQKIRRPAAEDNLSVDSEKDKTSNEPAANRTLKLEITDGVVTLLGFEDKPIRKLVEPFVPGVKIVLNGPIECRKGVLFLKNENIDILGGEVDTLHIPNAPENILARALGQPENPDPFKSLVGTNEVNQQENILEDDADAFQLIPDDIENSYSRLSDASHPSTSTNTGTSNSTSTQSGNTSSSISNRTKSTISQSVTNAFNSARGIKTNAATSNSNRNTFKQPEQSSLPNYEPSKFVPNRSLNNSAIELDDDDEFFALAAAETASIAEQEVKSNKISNTKQSSIQNFFSSEKNKNNYSSNSSCDTSSKRSASPKRNQTSTGKISKIQSSGNIDNKYDAKSSSRVNNEARSFRAQIEESYSDFMTAETEGAVDTNKNASNHKINRENASKDLFKEFNVIEDDLACKKDKKSDEIVTFPPKKYPCTQIVRGCVQKLTHKLSIRESQWTLSGIVKMKGIELEADFAAEALDIVFGMSAEELQAKQQEVKQNPQLKEKINQTLKKSQRRILSLDCDMKVHFSSYIAKPVILEIID